MSEGRTDIKKGIFRRVRVLYALFFFVGMLIAGKILYLQYGPKGPALRNKGTTITYERVKLEADRGDVLVDPLKYLPALVGAGLGLAQFLPEITQKRLKLTLHLPDSRRAMMLGMLGYGLVLLTMLFAVQLLAIGLYLRHLMAPELVHAVVSTTLPWYAAGFAGYLFAAWICIEPTWRQRLFDALIAAGVMRLLFSSDALRVCDTLLPWIAAVVLCALFFPLHSTLRFRRGCQD